MGKKEATKHCCSGKCKSDSRYPEQMPDGTTFIRFPKPGKIRENMTPWEREQAKLKTDKAMRWQYLCGRKDFTKLEQITKDTYICSLHFIGSKGPTDDNPEPILATLTPEERDMRQARKRKAPRERGERPVLQSKRKKHLSFDENQASSSADNQPEQIQIIPENNPEDNDTEPSDSCAILNDNATQTVYDQYILGSKVETMILRNQVAVQDKNTIDSTPKNTMNPSVVLKDRKKTKFFTGLFPEQFEALFTFLGPAKYELKYWNSKEKTNVSEKLNSKKSGPSRRFTAKEELFITLLRLRRGFSLQTIAYLYGVSSSLISEIFITWTQFMFLHFKCMKNAMFPTRDLLQSSLPKVFKSFKNVRCSVDCTEFFCQTPRDYGQQGNVYSSYKHHTTMKALIAVTPKGAACFVSDLFEGSVSDVDIFERCGIIKHIEPGDVLLVDKGFTVQDQLLSRQATIKIPAFLGKRDNLTKEEEMTTRRIAKARIHVERYNDRLKKFGLLSKTIPLSLSPVASQMVYVACCLVNFQSSLCT